MDIFKLLSEPFNPKTVKWRVGSTNAKKLGCKPWEATSGMALAYVDARIVMVRLDDVLGPNNWQDEYEETAQGRMLCKLSVRVGDEWITKSDGAGMTGTEGEKGAISDAFKRAAVKFGIGRYLYAFPNKWVDLSNGGIKTPPVLPDWALPSKDKSSPIRAAYENSEFILNIKDAIAADDFKIMQEQWGEITEADQEGLWVAPTKGGVFTTAERSYLQTNMSRTE